MICQTAAHDEFRFAHDGSKNAHDEFRIAPDSNKANEFQTIQAEQVSAPNPLHVT